MNPIEEILLLYNKLTLNEKHQLLEIISDSSNCAELTIDQQIKPSLTDSKLAFNLKLLNIDQPDSCPHCKSIKIISNGRINNRNRFLCKSCKRTFGILSGTILSGVKKMDKFLEFKEIMLSEGAISLKLMSKRVGVSHPTALDWRHKIIGTLSSSDAKFESEAQIDDIWVSYSQKGRKGLKYSKKRGGNKKAGDNNFQTKIITATNTSQTVMKVARIGRITKSDVQKKLGNFFVTGAKIVSDSHPSIIAFAKEKKLNHVCFKSKEHVANTGENVQFLNNQASRLKTMINKVCKGVSTKYLQNYANWFSFMETYKGKDVNEIATNTILMDKNGWDRFTNAEPIYKNFIENCSVRTYRCPVIRKWKANNWNNQNLDKMSNY